MTITRILLIALPLAMALLLAAISSAGHSSQDAISERAYWHEPCDGVPSSEQASGWLADPRADPLRNSLFDSLANQPFRSYRGVLAQGYGPCAVWVRLRIEPPRPRPTAAADPHGLEAGPVVLRLWPPFIDRITLHDPGRPDGPIGMVGDRQPARDRIYRSLAMHLAVPPAAEPRTLYLRIQTASTRMLDVQALSLRESIDRDRADELFSAGYLALLIVSLLVAIVYWQRGGDRLVRVFVMKQTVTVIWTMLLLGFVRSMSGASFETAFGTWIPAATIDTLTNLSVVTITAISIYFDRLLVVEYRPPNWGLVLSLACIAMWPIELALMAAGLSWLALAINAATAAIAMSVILAMLLTAEPATGSGAPAPTRGQMAIYYATVLVPVCGSMISQLGWVDGIRMSLYGLMVHGLLSGGLMLVLLAVRTRRMREQQAEAEAELERAQALIRQERVHRADREQLLDMLTHELRTPLAVMRMVSGTGEANETRATLIRRALEDMNDVIERCSQAGQLEGKQLQPQWQACDPRAELEALVNERRLILDRRIELEVDGSAIASGDPVGAVRTDPQLLRIVLANLLDNACKYGDADSPVEVRLTAAREPGRERLQVEVLNRPGVAGWPDPRRLFGKFYRAPGAHRTTGSGLGLYLAEGLTGLLRGTLTYCPSATQVCFRLSLPLR